MTYRNSKQRCLKPFNKIENSRLKWKILIVDLRPKKRRFRGNQIMKVVAEESMKRAAVEENSSSPDNGKWLEDERTFIVDWSRLTDSLIDKLAHYYGNAIRCNSTSVKEMRKAIWAVWGHSCSTDDERYTGFVLQIQIHGPVFADLSHPALLKKCLGGKTQNPNESLNSLIWKFCPKTIGSRLQIAEIAANLETSVFNDGNQILISILEKFGLKINRNVCVSLAERDNRRIFTS
ncbi:uncharacterized protein TNCV_2760651 [Trichonephila clavipes]|nr:uncharacterized protein TNCV_2760651 [Trichonephila clavipes]